MRKRATAIVVRDGKVLLVKERGREEYSLPGGGIDRHKDKVLLVGEEHCEGCYEARWTGFPCGLSHRARTSSRLAAVRELNEELGLRANRAKFLFHHTSAYHRHSVYLIGEVEGYCKPDKREITGYIWWDGRSPMNVSHSARDIIRKLNEKV